MGFFDILGGFVDTVVCGLDDLATGVGDDFKQLVDELTHDDNYVSPYRKKEQASQIIQKADYKLQRTQQRYRDHIRQVEKQLKENWEFKNRLYSRLHSGNRFRTNSSTVLFREISSPGFVGRDDFRMGEMLGIFGQELRDTAASCYLNDAKDYRVTVDREIAKIDRYDARLEELEMQLFAEKELFSMLERQITAKSNCQNYAMANLIRTLMDKALCDADGYLRDDYLATYQQLKNLT